MAKSFVPSPFFGGASGGADNLRTDGTMTLSDESLFKAILIRRFEERLLELFSEGKLNGTVHTCIGQEFTGVAVSKSLRDGDLVLSNHRGHGHYLSLKTGKCRDLLAEIMGRSTGLCGGIGGSQHIADDGFLSNGVQGGMTPVGVGAAFATDYRKENSVVVVYIGDGTLGEGIVYESMNLAAAWKVPIVFVLENNMYAQSTNSASVRAGEIETRVKGFGLVYIKTNTWDLDHLFVSCKLGIENTRNDGIPHFIEIETYRLKAHSKGDDNRDPAEVKDYEERDSLNRLFVTEEERCKEIDFRVSAELDAAVSWALEQPVCKYAPKSQFVDEMVRWSKADHESDRVSSLIHKSLERAFEESDDIVLIGEDIEGEYGGAFNVTRDLSLQFNGRVRNTSISEQAIIGIATGMAISGLKPVAEIMFGDFMTLTVDQLLQHATKFGDMYNGKVKVPLIVRTPMGGKRGYGPTHSQSIEKLFMGMYDLSIVALNHRVCSDKIYTELLKGIENPHLVIENKILYTRPLKTNSVTGYDVEFSSELFPAVRLRPIEAMKADLTIVCYGGCLEDVEASVALLFDEHDVLCEVICPSLISPLNIRPIAESVTTTGRLLTVEEGNHLAAFGTEVLARLVELGISVKSFKRIGYDGVIPSSFQREIELLVCQEKIATAASEVANGSD